MTLRAVDLGPLLSAGEAMLARYMLGGAEGYPLGADGVSLAAAIDAAERAIMGAR